MAAVEVELIWFNIFKRIFYTQSCHTPSSTLKDISIIHTQFHFIGTNGSYDTKAPVYPSIDDIYCTWSIRLSISKLYIRISWLMRTHLYSFIHSFIYLFIHSLFHIFDRVQVLAWTRPFPFSFPLRVFFNWEKKANILGRSTKILGLSKSWNWHHNQKKNCFSFHLMYHMICLKKFMDLKKCLLNNMFVNASVNFLTSFTQKESALEKKNKIFFLFLY